MMKMNNFLLECAFNNLYKRSRIQHRQKRKKFCRILGGQNIRFEYHNRKKNIKYYSLGEGSRIGSWLTAGHLVYNGYKMK
jgi:hypothetical protein